MKLSIRNEKFLETYLMRKNTTLEFLLIWINFRFGHDNTDINPMPDGNKNLDYDNPSLWGPEPKIEQYSR